MRILRKKNITNQTPVDAALQPAQVELEPVVDHETANAIASKEANEEAAEKNIEASGIQKVADEVVKSIQDPKKDTPAPKTPSLKPYTEAKQVVDRKALGALIKECKEAGRKYRVKKSLEEGFRYVFEEFEEDYPECYFVCHSDDDANNENGYFDTLEDAKAYAEGHPEICCVFKVCANEEEKVWEKPLEECSKQDVKEDVEEDVVIDASAEPAPQVVADEIPETFEGKMDFLAADEDEAIASYEKILPLIEEESVKEQLTKILEEEKAHKSFLEAVKADHSLVYSHEHAEEETEEPELVAQEAEVGVIEESKEEDKVKKLQELKIKSISVDEANNINKTESTIGDNFDEHDLLDAVSEGEDEYINALSNTKAIIVLPDDAAGCLLKDGKIMDISGSLGYQIKEAADFFKDLGVSEEVSEKIMSSINESVEVCPECGKEICECNKQKVEEDAQLKAVSDMADQKQTDEKPLDEAIVSPVSEPEDKDAVPAVDIAGEIKVEGEPEVVPEEDTAVVEITPELDPEAEIEIDSIETFEPTDEIGKKTMTTIKDAGDGAMFAFKDTLKDLYNLKIKVSDLQQLLSTSSDWLLDLLGFNHDSEMEIHPEELPEEPTPVEEPEIVGGEFDEVKPVTDLSTIDINDFDEVDPVDYEEEDEKFFVED